MRLSLVACAVLGTAYASSLLPLERRDFDTITAVLTNVSSSVIDLSNMAKTGNADPGTLLKASDRMVQTLQSGIVNVNATGNLTFIETVHLIGPVHKMSQLSADLTKNMVKLKSSIERQRLCEVVRLQIGNINEGATGLIKAVNTKVPSAALDISQALSQGITDTLQKIQQDFSSQNCVDGRNETTASSSGTRAPSTVSSSIFVLHLALFVFLAIG
ncbi:hypothetical protein NLG97_g319 [Lecanicillium saksenae]|uniref:Uncharacterized protein n=1 Tax=Lecanicillium saksenae TaxID=468837 RepID=A0ACC1R886_9HYPO|nr:hypothetical protein NLG97_g319 [Lecanicillium saksenae]